MKILTRELFKLGWYIGRLRSARVLRVFTCFPYLNGRKILLISFYNMLLRIIQRPLIAQVNGQL